LILFETKNCQNPEFQSNVFVKFEEMFQILILKILSEKKSLHKEAIYKDLAAIVGYQLNPCLVDSILDAIWFEEMIKTENQEGKCTFSLTEKGKKAIMDENRVQMTVGPPK
jgi:predicted transcriptional regulator